MGFYIDLNPVGVNGSEFRETEVPPVFWFLYVIAGFALLCMGLTAHTLLRSLAKTGAGFDLILVSLILGFVPFYFLIGFKLGILRKAVSFSGEKLFTGHLWGGKPFLQKKLNRTDIKEILLVNLKPSPNVARVSHDNTQYFIRGHWRVIAVTRDGKQFTLDRHTEKGALDPLYQALVGWLGCEYK